MCLPAKSYISPLWGSKGVWANGSIDIWSLRDLRNKAMTRLVHTLMNP
jgi:hypothetical protein